MCLLIDVVTYSGYVIPNRCDMKAPLVEITPDPYKH